MKITYSTIQAVGGGGGGGEFGGDKGTLLAQTTQMTGMAACNRFDRREFLIRKRCGAINWKLLSNDPILFQKSLHPRVPK